MKKYFAKYLPVEGEIKEGFYTDITEPNSLFKVDDGNIPLQPTEDFKKVKLFLCSREIQWEDEIIWIGENTAIHTFGKKWKYVFPAPLHKNWIKVIGEISPNAVWVKEGDEFDEEGVDFVIAVTDEDYEKPAKEQKPFYMIKCPTCKTFH